MAETHNDLVRLLDACVADDGLKERFKADPRGVMAERGIEVPDGITFTVVEDTDTCAHITLPKKIPGVTSASSMAQGMGDYYRSLICWVLNMSVQQDALMKVFDACWADDGFKARLVADPRMALAEHGIDPPADLDFKIVENTDDCVHITLPRRTSDELSDAELCEVAGGLYYSTIAHTGARSL